MILNLSPGFNPSPHLTPITFTNFEFPGGEPHIRIDTDGLSEEVTISHRITDFRHVGEILIANDALRRAGAHRIKLILPYFPAARQDRVMVKGEGLTVKIYADLINSCHFESVLIFDPHSDVTPALLDNCLVENNIRFAKTVVEQINEPNLILISSDGGALKKVYKVAEALSQFEVIECSKSRDVSTGQIKDFQVYSNELENRPCLIIDDICDGGGTFLGLAEALKDKGAGALYLAVSHGIFSKGLDSLSEKYETIFTTNSLMDFSDHKCLNQIDLSHGLLSEHK